MERLTKRDETGDAIISALSDMTADLYTGLGDNEQFLTDALNKLAAYEDAEEQGRLVVLPCKVGAMVYEITPRHTINTMYVDRFEIRREEIGAILILTDGYRWSPCDHKTSEIGKTVFLTREEAEKALEGMNNG